MKVLLLSLFLLTTSVFASTGETRVINYNGSVDTVSALLRGEETHTEYRYEQRNSICYRTVIIGYRTECRGGGGPRGGDPRYCSRYPVYGTQSYPCVITVQIPYEVKDFDTQATTIIKFNKLPDDVTTGETFRLVLNGSDLKLEAKGSKKFFLQLVQSDVQVKVNGSMKMIEANYTVELIKSAPVLSAINVGDLSIEDNIFRVGMGALGDRAHFAFNLTVTRVKTFGSDPVLFDRELTVDEYALTGEGANTVAEVNVEKLGLELFGGKFRITPVFAYKAPGTLLNSADFEGQLESSRSLLFTNR